MSDIPIFSAQGKTDSEKLAELIKFMPSLSSAIERQVSSLDFNNLNESLRNRIENSITEHQDLSGFSTNAYTNRKHNEAVSDAIYYAGDAYDRACSYAASEASSAEENAKSYAASKASSAEQNAKSYADILFQSLEQALEEIKTKAEAAHKQACTHASWYESDTLLDRVEELEGYH